MDTENTLYWGRNRRMLSASRGEEEDGAAADAAGNSAAAGSRTAADMDEEIARVPCYCQQCSCVVHSAVAATDAGVVAMAAAAVDTGELSWPAAQPWATRRAHVSWP